MAPIRRDLTSLTSFVYRRGVKSNTWQLHEAKARFSELFRKARSEGPQRVEKHHGEAVIIIPAEEYEREQALKKQPESLVEFLRQASVELDISRSKDPGRTIEW